MTKSTFLLTVLLGLSLSHSPAQGQGTPITFHITSVRSEEVRSGKGYEWCDGCSITRYTVEGYSDVRGDGHVTEYILECDDIISASPSSHYIVACDHVHANNDYKARLLPNAIAFREYSPHSPDEPMQAAYEIKSEKEQVSKEKR